MTEPNLVALAEITKQIAWGAAEILRAYYRGDTLKIQQKENEPVTAADLAVSEYILNQLQGVLEDETVGYLNEETYKAHQGKIDKPWVWIIDPLDGTRDFIDKTGEYAIHIALTHQGKLILAVVAVPEAEKIYSAILGQGTFVETKTGIKTPLRVVHQKDLQDCALVVSRTHRGDRFNSLLAQLPCQNQKFVGSVGCKIAAIVEQQAEIYISLSGKSAPKDWDMAAPELILTEAGGKFTHADGKPLEYNTGDINQWGCLVASYGQHHQALCQQISTFLADH